MIFRDRLKTPCTLIRLGMLCLILFNLWPRVLRLTFGLGPDWVDGLRGMLLGMAMGLVFMAIRLKGRQGRGAC